MPNLPAPLPTCQACGVRLQLRAGWTPGQPGNGHTREQRDCGTWYDHPTTSGSLIGHTASTLYPSPALQALQLHPTT